MPAPTTAISTSRSAFWEGTKASWIRGCAMGSPCGGRASFYRKEALDGKRKRTARKAPLSPARRRQPRHADRGGRAAFADLLAPHGVIEPLVLQQLGVAAGLDDVAALED